MNLDNIEQFVGQHYSETLGAQIKSQTGARQLRVIAPNMSYTMELLGDRLDVFLNKNGTILQIQSS